MKRLYTTTTESHVIITIMPSGLAYDTMQVHDYINTNQAGERNRAGLVGMQAKYVTCAKHDLKVALSKSATNKTCYSTNILSSAH